VESIQTGIVKHRLIEVLQSRIAEEAVVVLGVG
jgi:hypothetical protein